METTPHPRHDVTSVLENVRAVADTFAADRHDRQRRRSLDPADFERLRDAGFLLTGVPAEHGGIFESIERSTRPISYMLRALAGGDASVALVAAMHPSVLYSGRWLVAPEAPEPYTAAWHLQCAEFFGTVLDGHWWGTITSEPGSGGNMANTKARATLDDDGEYRIWGEKHFGSGSGVVSFMVTTAVAEGEADPDWYILDMRGVPWDGSTGLRLRGEWDGHGMTATQSHAFAFEGLPARRSAHRGRLTAQLDAAVPQNVGLVPCLYTAVVVGIVEAAVDVARQRLAPRRGSLSAYEQVEWTNVLQEAWLIEQAFEGMLRDTEERHGRDTLRGKTVIASIAESLMTRVCRVMGGGSFARHAPFGFWFEDVRALGFLRPPWTLAHEALDEMAWPAEA